MGTSANHRLFVYGGICGILGTVFYILSITIFIDPVISYLLAMFWPILTIIFAYSLYEFLELHESRAVNKLALIFACLAFTMVALMISVQLSVKFGMEEIFLNTLNKEGSISDLRQTMRLVDLGIDVAWDLFIGTSLIFLSLALGSNSKFGKWWGIPGFILGVTLIILNTITFPWPPDSRGLVDVGPLIGLFIILLSGKLIVLGNRMRDKIPEFNG